MAPPRHGTPGVCSAANLAESTCALRCVGLGRLFGASVAVDFGHSGAELSRWLESREAYHTAGFQFSVQIKLVSDSSHRKALGEVPHNGAI